MDPIDLNADLGEGFGRWTLTDDDALLSVVTSANVACGFHAGDPSTMRRVCERAVEAGVRIGAQVSYRDLAGFGRRTMDVPPGELADEVTYQIGALAAFAAAAGDRVRYVKPHGALYNRIVADGDQAAAVVAGVVRAGGDLSILGLPGSAVLACAAEAGLPTVTEGFVDRAYEPDGTLVSRRRPGAVLSDEASIVGQAVRLARSGEVVAMSGEVVAVRPRSLCLHGDTPGAAALAAAVRRALTEAGATIAPRVILREVGSRALLVELGDVDEVRTWHAALVAGRDDGRLPAVEEIVPGARTVLLDGLDSPSTVAAELATWELSDVEWCDVAGALVEIPTIYDGEDLPWVAARWDLDVEGAVAEHSRTELRAAFCGFAPGFAYLVGLPPSRHLPRRATPRPRVPAGAVAVAGEYSAVYPSASPGGWHLIGRTDAVLWDPARARPALIAPGDRVRFVAVGP